MKSKQIKKIKKAGKNVNKAEKIKNKAIITVKNAEGDPDTVAQIVVQNKIDYEPKVSVIIPVYNVEDYLRECLDSVVNQTLKEIEIICVDDGSTDKSLDILLEYAKKDNRITVLKQENLHAGVARNAGLAVARGEYLSFLDSDDFFELNMHEEMYKKAKEDDADVVVCNAQEYDTKTGKYNVCRFPVSPQLFPDKDCVSAEELGDKLFQANSCLAWNKLLNASFVCSINLKCAATKSCNDNVFIYGLLTRAQKIVLYNKVFVNYRVNNPNSLQRSKASSWECVCLAYVALKKKMQEMDVYEKYRRTFVNKALQSCLYYWSTIEGEAKQKLYDALQNKYFDLLDIKDYGEDYYYNKLQYKQLISMVETTIPIILSSDNNYAPFMYTTMLSILKNAHKHTFYDFYLMVPSVFSIKNEKNIMLLKKQFNCDIHFIDMKDAFSDLTMQISHITSPTYYRLLAADLLPRKYDKCIYLDVDICVQQDLSPMLNIDMGGNYVAGVIAAAYCIKSEYNKERLQLSTVSNYINAGVLLMNLKKIREDNLTTKFLELSKKNYSSQDQDVVNVACFGKILVLPVKYNLMTKYKALFDIKHKQYGVLEKIYGKKNIEVALKNPVIIHYADKIKPWNDKNTQYAMIWWSYANTSPYFKQYFSRIKSYLLFPYYLLAVGVLRKKKARLLAEQELAKRSKQKVDKNRISIKLLKCLPVFTYKNSGGKKVWKFFGLPLFKKRTTDGGKNIKFYVFGVNVMQYSKKTTKVLR